MKQIFGFFLSLSLVACASSRVKDESIEKENDPRTAAFERGMKALEGEDYATAAELFDGILVARPGTEFDLIALYNSAAAYEGLGECARAGGKYREVVRSSATRFRRVEAQALFRLSLMYECLNQDAKAITALLDARKRGNELSNEIIGAEIPARLAAAYARMGNREKALQYFGEASRGLKALLASPSSSKTQQETISRTMYFMGRLNSAQRNATASPTTYLQSLSMQQPYLLQAMELAHPVWGQKAYEDLHTAYANIWQFKIDNPDQRREFYTRALQNVAELRKIRLPNASAYADQTFAELDRTQTKLQNELALVAETNRLTPDAERREGLRRQGRVVDLPKNNKVPGAAAKKGVKR